MNIWRKSRSALKMVSEKGLRRTLLAVSDFLVEPLEVRGTPAFLQIEPTILCNLECKFCINPFLDRAREALTLEKFQRILDQVPTVVKISLVGIGESTLNKSLFELVREAKRRGIEIGTTSNGTILNEKILDGFVNSGLDWLNFSLDGATKETYEQMRPGATFEKTLENIRRVVAAVGDRPKPKLDIWFLSTSYNIHELPLMIPLVKSLGIRKLCTQGVHYWGHENWKDGASKANAVPDLRRRLREARDLAEREGLEFVAQNFPDPSRPRACKWPWKGSYITADGFVTPCCENGSDPKKINFGNLFETSYGRIWNGKNYQEFRKELKSSSGRPKICESCPSYYQTLEL
jgi:radical SAM protein with 4Fe4S-binding SPASM domain